VKFGAPSSPDSEAQTFEESKSQYELLSVGRERKQGQYGGLHLGDNAWQNAAQESSKWDTFNTNLLLL
jgi:hypothetical protein